MKILMVNKYLHNKGGTEKVLFELSKLLEMRGHQIIYFSQKHPKNIVNKFERYFLSYIDFESFTNLFNSIRSFSRIFYSFEARYKMERIIRNSNPDIIHIHMIDHHISPSILHTAKKHNIPVIASVNNYKYVCPNYLLYIPHRNEPCMRCIPNKFYNCVIYKCQKKSYLKSALVCAESYLHHLLKIYKNNIKYYLVSNEFRKEVMIQSGYSEEKIIVLPHPLDLSNYSYCDKFDNYIVYFGRFSSEKGLLTLIQAMEKCPNILLKIIGKGPSESEMKKMILANDINNVELLGPMYGADMKKIVSLSRFVIIPSEYYEGITMAALESFAMGKPVIASRIGGLKYLIKEQYNGLFFTPKDYNELADKIKMLYSNESEIKRLGKNARNDAEKLYLNHNYVETIENLYKKSKG